LLNSIQPVRALQVFHLMRFSTVFLTGILLAKTGIDLESIGRLEALLLIGSAFSFFWVNGLLNGLLSRHGAMNPENGELLIRQTGILLATFGLLTASLLLAAHRFIPALFSDFAADELRLLSLFIFLNSPTFLIEYILLLRMKTAALLRYGIISFPMQIMAVLLPVWTGYSILYSIAGLILLALLRNFYLLRLQSGFRYSSVNFNDLGSQLRFSLPLIVSLLLSGSAEYIDGFLVTSNFGPEAFAIFRYGARELPLSMLLSAAMSTALVANLAAGPNDQERLAVLKKESLRLMHLLFPASMILLLSSAKIYPFIFSESFRESAEIFNIYLLLIISRMLFPQTLVMAIGKSAIIFRLAIMEIVLNAGCSVLFMQYFGIRGIAFGTLFAFFAEKAGLCYYLYRKEGINPGSYVPLKWWTFYSAGLIILYACVRFFNGNI